MKLFNTRIEYGFKAITLLANRADENPLNAGQIASELGIPKEYTSKILQALAKDGLIESKRGKNGGFKLTKDPGNLSIGEILYSLGIELDANKCLLGFEVSGNCSTCFINDQWKSFSSRLAKNVDHYSLRYLADRH